MRDVKIFLFEQRNAASRPELVSKWERMEKAYYLKFWPELTAEFLEFVKDTSLQTKEGLVDLYNKFIADFAHY